jgi:hypothetical protein
MMTRRPLPPLKPLPLCFSKDTDMGLTKQLWIEQQEQDYFDEKAEWIRKRHRSLEGVYPIVYLDAIVVKGGRFPM